MNAKKSKKILVVDDDHVIVKLVHDVLSLHGYTVVTASDGLDALVAVKRHKPDLIVLDIMMPEINGYEVCRNLKFDKEYKEIPILILTSRDQELDPRIGELMGIDYIQKPINTQEFLTKIEYLVG